MTWLWRRIWREYASHRCLIATETASFLHSVDVVVTQYRATQLDSDSFTYTPEKKCCCELQFIHFKADRTHARCWSAVFYGGRVTLHAWIPKSKRSLVGRGSQAHTNQFARVRCCRPRWCMEGWRLAGSTTSRRDENDGFKVRIDNIDLGKCK